MEMWAGEREMSKQRECTPVEYRVANVSVSNLIVSSRCEIGTPTTWHWHWRWWWWWTGLGNWWWNPSRRSKMSESNRIGPPVVESDSSCTWLRVSFQFDYWWSDDSSIAPNRKRSSSVDWERIRPCRLWSAYKSNASDWRHFDSKRRVASPQPVPKKWHRESIRHSVRSSSWWTCKFGRDRSNVGGNRIERCSEWSSECNSEQWESNPKKTE